MSRDVLWSVACLLNFPQLVFSNSTLVTNARDGCHVFLNTVKCVTYSIISTCASIDRERDKEFFLCHNGSLPETDNAHQC